MTKATRRLTDIKFEHEGAHVALVGKHQGGPANGITTLITKATNNITQEQIEKASTVSVTMQFPEFLRKFFGLYWDDAEVLSAVMGYGRTEYPDTNEKDWIDSRVESINIMKAVYKAQDVEKALAALTPEQHLAIMADQEMLEKAFADIPEHTIEQKEPEMETILKSAHEEFVTKAVADAVAEVQKSLDAQAEVLKAAQDKLAEFETAAAAAVTKSRTEALTAVVAADKVEALMKSLAPLDAEAFAAVVETFAVQKAAEAGSEMFNESGVAGDGAKTADEVDATTAILKAKYGK
ncbi:hypothetical protein CNR37_00007 [Pseudomonas phage ventosus]|uniref:Uncharacterized protein n=1 Tax=Pseudomonas phage ventosus TaxID=2048980 RepID=A0A2H4P7S8_9CAUD|nr:hypothetical protein CNR37_00007 [Pseudomonas phage ventosus]